MHDIPTLPRVTAISWRRSYRGVCPGFIVTRRWRLLAAPLSREDDWYPSRLDGIHGNHGGESGERRCGDSSLEWLLRKSSPGCGGSGVCHLTPKLAGLAVHDSEGNGYGYGGHRKEQATHYTSYHTCVV